MDHPCFATFGPENGRPAIILSPVMAAWDGGVFCQFLLDTLAGHGYRVTIYDSLSITDQGGGLERQALAWDALLRTRHSRIDLAVGQAYGGALLYYLLDGILADCPKVLAISAPTHASEPLRTGLDAILDEAERAGDAAAVRALDFWVQPVDSLVPASGEAPPGTSARFRFGFMQLRAADARSRLDRYRGHLLALYGEASKLVNRNCISLSRHRVGQMAVGLSGCGMRPLADAPDLALGLISHFLNEETHP